VRSLYCQAVHPSPVSSFPLVACYGSFARQINKLPSHQRDPFYCGLEVSDTSLPNNDSGWLHPKCHQLCYPSICQPTTYPAVFERWKNQILQMRLQIWKYSEWNFNILVNLCFSVSLFNFFLLVPQLWQKSFLCWNRYVTAVWSDWLGFTPKQNFEWLFEVLGCFTVLYNNSRQIDLFSCPCQACFFTRLLMSVCNCLLLCFWSVFATFQLTSLPRTSGRTLVTT